MDMYKILLVDDEPDNLALLYRTLRGKYELMKTTSPIEALDILSKNHIDLVISDHKMPEMDGVEFLKRVYDNYPDTMRLLVTAYTDSVILIDAINYAKIYRYIKKPYEPSELLLTVANTLEYLQLKMDNASLINDLKDLFTGTIKAIIEAMDAKDSFTMGRSRRVTFFAVKIAKALNSQGMMDKYQSVTNHYLGKGKLVRDCDATQIDLLMLILDDLNDIVEEQGIIIE